MDANIYLNDEEVIQVIRDEMTNLQNSELNNLEFRTAYDALHRVLESLNNVSSVILEGNEVLF